MGISDVLTLMALIGGIAVMYYMVRNLDRDRRSEESARTFFDEHGHWPDETPEQAAAERELLREAADRHLAAFRQPDADGRV